MGDKTGIQWTGKTWNPTRGCSRISEGCRNCYAEGVSARFSGPGQPYHRLAVFNEHGKGRWTGVVELVPKALDQPLRWQRPDRIFVNSMSDVFHESLSNEDIAAIFAVMAASSRHTFQVLTKRAKRMVEWFRWVETRRDPGMQQAPKPHYVHPFSVLADAAALYGLKITTRTLYEQRGGGPAPWPLKNVHLGVSIEDQASALERIPELLKIDGAVRFVSYEPALQWVNLEPYMSWYFFMQWAEAKDIVGHWHVRTDESPLHWIIIGGESGPGARPFNTDWALDTVALGKRHRVPIFVKQLGARPYSGRRAGAPEQQAVSIHHYKGGDMDEWPEALRVREFPAGYPQ